MAANTLPHKGAVGKGTILALDLGSKMGWALSQTGSPITSGVVEFKPGRFEGGGMRFLRFKNWLDDVLRFAAPIEQIVLEEVRSHVGTTAAHVYGGFLAHLTAWAEQHKIPYQGVPVGTVKKFATGKGNASKSMVIEAMVKRGHHPADDNAADALALLHWTLDKGETS